jgi:heterodisulfide reductase subunit C
MHVSDPQNSVAVERTPTLAQDLREMTGVNVATCYQCGKCSAGCPMAADSQLRPHRIMRLAMQDRRDELLQDESIWYCLTCETCSARCPNACDPARVIDAARELAGAAGHAAQDRSIRAFHEAFLDQIRNHGRVHETGFVLQYKLKSGRLLRDAENAPAMLLKGKLSARAHKVRDQESIRRIFRLCHPVADGAAGASGRGGAGVRPQDSGRDPGERNRFLGRRRP